MTLEDFKKNEFPNVETNRDCIVANAALEWLKENTTLDIIIENPESIKTMPSGAKLFVLQYMDIMNLSAGVSSESIEGLSQSFDSTARNALIWQYATELLAGCLKSQVKVFPAKRKW